MNQSTGRGVVRQFARNADDSSTYTDAQIDRAIYTICSRFVLNTRCLPLVSTIALAAASSAVTPLPSGFRPDLLMSAYLSGLTDNKESCRIELETIDWFTLQDSLLHNTQQRTPRAIAFADFTTAAVYPIPDSAYSYSVNLRWSQPFTALVYGAQGAWSASASYQIGDQVSSGGHVWLALKPSINSFPAAGATWSDLGAGTVTAPAAVTLNLPDEWLMQILIHGATTLLQFTSPEHQYAQPSWKMYEEFEKRMSSAGHLGTKVARRGVGAGSCGPGGARRVIREWWE